MGPLILVFKLVVMSAVDFKAGLDGSYLHVMDFSHSPLCGQPGDNQYGKLIPFLTYFL